jgi:hypothetical protein
MALARPPQSKFVSDFLARSCAGCECRATLIRSGFIRGRASSGLYTALRMAEALGQLGLEVPDVSSASLRLFAVFMGLWGAVELPVVFFLAGVSGQAFTGFSGVWRQKG